MWSNENTRWWECEMVQSLRETFGWLLRKLMYNYHVTQQFRPSVCATKTETRD